ncbi:unnamed protein product [Rotaria sp. Silwood2]|nr:unnamed protein product [Rotaria sp. Silwood2]
MSSDRVRITIYECFSTIHHRVVKETEITKSKSILIETSAKVLELIVGVILIVLELYLSIKYMIQLKKYIFVNEKLFKTFIETLIRLSSLITILIFYLLRVIVYVILMFCKDDGNLRQSLQKIAEFILCLIATPLNYYITLYKIKEEEPVKEEGEQRPDKIEVLPLCQSGDITGQEIRVTRQVLKLRPYILSCIVKYIDFAMNGNLKKYTDLQNEVNDRICKQQVLAKISTHDLSFISGNLVYDARQPEEIGLVPLDEGSKIVSARNFYNDLCEKAERERRSNRKNKSSNYHKHLTLTVVPDQQKFPYLCDQNHRVISLPPLTDGEPFKLTPSTESILIQATSEYSIEYCRCAIDFLIQKMLQIGLGKKLHDSKFRHTLTLQRTKVVNEKGELITMFPSRIDLDWRETCREILVIERLT